MRVNVVIWCHHLQHMPSSWICHHQVKMWLVHSRIVVLLLQVTWGTTPFLPFSVQMALYCAAFCSALGFSYPSLSWWLQDCSASSCHYLSSSPSFLGVVSMLWAPTVHPCGPHNLPIILSWAFLWYLTRQFFCRYPILFFFRPTVFLVHVVYILWSLGLSRSRTSDV